MGWTVTTVRRQAVIRGQVQGVGFRMNTRSVALKLGLAGSASNQPDGSVRVVAEGEQTQVDRLIDWLHRGPRYARVDSVTVEELATTGEAGFSVD